MGITRLWPHVVPPYQHESRTYPLLAVGTEALLGVYYSRASVDRVVEAVFLGHDVGALVAFEYD